MYSKWRLNWPMGVKGSIHFPEGQAPLSSLTLLISLASCSENPGSGYVYDRVGIKCKCILYLMYFRYYILKCIYFVCKYCFGIGFGPNPDY